MQERNSSFINNQQTKNNVIILQNIPLKTLQHYIKSLRCLLIQYFYLMKINCISLLINFPYLINYRGDRKLEVILNHLIKLIIIVFINTSP